MAKHLRKESVIPEHSMEPYDVAVRALLLAGYDPLTAYRDAYEIIGQQVPSCW